LSLSDPRPILFFDGVCGLCNAAVDFILKRDRKQVFMFAALQGETAQTRLGVKPDDNLTTMILVEGDAQWTRSDAALRVAWHLGGIYRVIALLRVVPAGVRNVIYDWVSRNRIRWFGQKERCRMPTPSERARFLP